MHICFEIEQPPHFAQRISIPEQVLGHIVLVHHIQVGGALELRHEWPVALACRLAMLEADQMFSKDRWNGGHIHMCES